MNEDKQKQIIQIIVRALGPDKLQNAARIIKNSCCPAFTAMMLLTDGMTKGEYDFNDFLYKQNIFFKSHLCVPTRLSWTLDTEKTQFKSDEIVPSEKTNRELFQIAKFLELHGCSVTVADLMKNSNKYNKIFNSETILLYMLKTGWHSGINSRRVFANIGDDASRGLLTGFSINGYNQREYPDGYPVSSGLKKCQKCLINDNWVSTGKELDDRNANVPQVTLEMENIEDNSNQLDVEIARNKNVIRLLRFGGKKAVFLNTQVVEEMNILYHKRGGFIVSQMENDAFADLIFPNIMKRLKERAKALYIKKVTEPRSWSKKLEQVLCQQRTIFTKTQLDKLPKEYDSFIIDKINFAPEEVSYIYQFVEIASPDEKNSPQFKNVLDELRNPEKRVLTVSYMKSLTLYFAALFLSELMTADVIDDINTSSVKTAIGVGLSDPDVHGYKRIVKFVGTAIQKPHSKRVCLKPLQNAAVKIAGHLFVIDFNKSNKIARAGRRFIQILRDFCSEPDSEKPFVNCELGNGNLSVCLASGAKIKFDITNYEKSKK